MGVSRTRSKSFKRAEKDKAETEGKDDQDQPTKSNGPKTSQMNNQGSEDIWDVGAVYNTDNIMPKKSIVTYSKRKYKSRPELGNLMTSFPAKGSINRKQAGTTNNASSSSLSKETPEHQNRTISTNQANNKMTVPEPTVSQKAQAENGTKSSQNDTNAVTVDQDHKEISRARLNARTISSSSAAAGKQKVSIVEKTVPNKKSLSISRTRRERQLGMDQDDALQDCNTAVDMKGGLSGAGNANNNVNDEDKGQLHTEAKHQDELQVLETPHDQVSSLSFDTLQTSLDGLNLSPIGNINRTSHRIVSSTPVGFRIQQQQHVSKPLKSFSETLKEANIDMADKELEDNDDMTEDIASFVVVDNEQKSILEVPISPRSRFDGGDLVSQPIPDNNPLAPASATFEILPQPTNTMPNLEEHRKAIEASIAEPSMHDFSNAQIWSPPRSPTIEVARRQSQRSDTQSNIPEGLFEWFGNNIQSQASTELNGNVDEELEHFLTPEQLDMTVEQFMRSIYEDKIEQIRKEGQKRIDRLNEELARVRAKLLAELDFVHSNSEI